MMAPLLFVDQCKPGSAMMPLPGVEYKILDVTDNTELEGNNA